MPSPQPTTRYHSNLNIKTYFPKSPYTFYTLHAIRSPWNPKFIAHTQCPLQPSTCLQSSFPFLLLPYPKLNYSVDCIQQYQSNTSQKFFSNLSSVPIYTCINHIYTHDSSTKTLPKPPKSQTSSDVLDPQNSYTFTAMYLKPTHSQSKSKRRPLNNNNNHTTVPSHLHPSFCNVYTNSTSLL